ncbi:hypothetical protein AB3S75_027508 [Citrus x aurantiifolia]
MLRLTHLTTNSLSLRRPFAFDPAIVASIFAIASDCFQSIFATSCHIFGENSVTIGIWVKVASIVGTTGIRAKVISVVRTITIDQRLFQLVEQFGTKAAIAK